MYFLGVDPSLTNTGYAIIHREKSGIDKIKELGLIQTPENMLEILRYSYIADYLGKLIKKYDLKKVASESPIFGEIQSENMFALYSQIKQTFFKNKVDVVYFSPMQVKMLAKNDFSDHRKMSKIEMITEMKEDLKLDKTSIEGFKLTGDIADAYHIARFGDRFWKYYDQEIAESDLTATEYKAFAFQKIFKRGLKKGKIDPKQRGIIHKENELFFKFSSQRPFKKIKGKSNKLEL